LDGQFDDFIFDRYCGWNIFNYIFCESKWNITEDIYGSADIDCFMVWVEFALTQVA
jgi:hypothetical protein